MRNLTYSLLSVLAFLFLVASCRDCPPCPKDMEVPQCFEDLVPYKVGDTILFRNSLGDTMQFICGGKAYHQNPNALEDFADQGCCPSYMVESLASSLTTDNGYLSFRTTEYDPIYMNIYLNLNGDKKETYTQNCLTHTMDSLKLTHLTFYNVEARKLYPSEDTIYLNQSEKLGVVGFKLSGVEWAKIK